MVTTRPGVSVEADVWTQFRNEVPEGERSSKLEALMREFLDVDNQGIEELERRLEDEQDKLEGLQEDKVSLEREISEVESNISTIRSALREKQREEDEKRDTLERFERLYHEKDRFTDDQKQFWKDKTGMEWPELMEEVKP